MECAAEFVTDVSLAGQQVPPFAPGAALIDWSRLGALPIVRNNHRTPTSVTHHTKTHLESGQRLNLEQHVMAEKSLLIENRASLGRNLF